MSRWNLSANAVRWSVALNYPDGHPEVLYATNWSTLPQCDCYKLLVDARATWKLEQVEG